MSFLKKSVKPKALGSAPSASKVEKSKAKSSKDAAEVPIKKIERKPKVSVKDLTKNKNKKKTAPQDESGGLQKQPFKETKNKEEQVKKKKFLSKKERRQLRLKSKKHSDLVVKLLPKWEVLRREDTPKEKRFDLIAKILTITKKKLVDLCMAHDTARIIECAIQHGTEAQRWEIFGYLKSSLRLLAKSYYARHVVQKLIKYGAKEHRLELLKVFRGHVARLVKHRIASELVDLLYNDYANATQRAALMQELYGNVHALKLAENQVHSLSEALSLNPQRRAIMLSNLTDLLASLATKGLTKYSIVQHLLLEYLQVQASSPAPLPTTQENTNTTTAAAAKQIDQESESATESQTNLLSLLETLVDGQIVPMLHTREGVRAALHVLWASPVRLRKTLVRGLKTCISSIARDEHGHLFLIGLLDAIDDIVLLEKFVIKEILDDLELFCIHPEARKVLLYALSPRDSRHFSPQLQQSVFYPGDRNPYTRKSLGVRALELRNPSIRLLPKLLQLASDRLTDLFTGSTTDAGRLAYEDRGRLVLLCEILLRSAPHHLNPDTTMQAYQRSSDAADSSVTASISSSVVISAADVQRLSSLRCILLEQLVQQLLVPEFKPLGSTRSSIKSSVTLSRDELRMQRHRKARLRVEQSLLDQNKPKFVAFGSGEPMDTAESDQDQHEVDEDKHDVLVSPDTKTPLISFVERPEGQLLLRWLLQDSRTHKDFTLGRLIMKHVSASNLLAWTRCNRSCFVLVNLFEVGDPECCQSLRVILAPCLDELSISPLPGAKVLLKLLQSEQ